MGILLNLKNAPEGFGLIFWLFVLFGSAAFIVIVFLVLCFGFNIGG